MTLSTIRRWSLRLCLALLLAAPAVVSAQTTYTVTTVPPDGDHPNPNAHDPVYALGGVQGRDILVKRGETYIFQMENVASTHPFYLTTSAVGGGAAPYTEGVTGNGATGNEALTFIPSENTPDTLYYGSTNDPNMGWRILVTKEITLNIGFAVTVVTPNGSHPNPDANPLYVYAIDDLQGAEITLERGETYTFHMNNVSAIHPFYITTSPTGAGSAPYNDGVTGNGVTGNDVLTLVTSNTTPDTLYYGCMVHDNMGWRLLIVPSLTGGVKDNAANAGILSVVAPNPVQGRGEFTLTPPRSGAVRIALVGADGREAQVLHEGTMAAGVKRTFQIDAATVPAGTYRLQVTGAGFNVGQNISVSR